MTHHEQVGLLDGVARLLGNIKRWGDFNDFAQVAGYQAVQVGLLGVVPDTLAFQLQRISVLCAEKMLLPSEMFETRDNYLGMLVLVSRAANKSTDQTEPQIFFNLTAQANTFLSLTFTAKKQIGTYKRSLCISTNRASILFSPLREADAVEGVIAQNREQARERVKFF